MREILFRGKSRDTNKWVFGDFVSDACGISHKEYLNEHGDIGDIMTYVIPETVGQYTGLTDKNGKQIFEGDIVKDDPRETEVVKYEGGGFAPFAIPNWECTPDADWVEIIGNIHDNPELMGGDTND